MSQILVVSSIAAYGVGVIIWLMAWKKQQDHGISELMKLAQDTHTLVNSNMGVQLKLGMELADFKAMTTKSPEDIQAAKLARHRYEEHLKKQAIVDSGKATPVPATPTASTSDIASVREDVRRLNDEHLLVVEPPKVTKPRAKRVRSVQRKST